MRTHWSRTSNNNEWRMSWMPLWQHPLGSWRCYFILGSGWYPVLTLQWHISSRLVSECTVIIKWTVSHDLKNILLVTLFSVQAAVIKSNLFISGINRGHKEIKFQLLYLQFLKHFQIFHLEVKINLESNPILQCNCCLSSEELTNSKYK